MSYTAIENTPINVDLVAVTKDTGWSLPGDGTAKHDACNAGTMKATGIVLVSGGTYNISYQIISISSGQVKFGIGDNSGGVHTGSGFVQETIVANGDLIPYFYSNGTCVIKFLNIQTAYSPLPQTSTTTIAYSVMYKKWTSFYSMAPDYGFSMFVRTLVLQGGILYNQQNGSQDRNNFFGTQYQSLFKFIEAKEPAMIKSYNSLVLQSNELLVTTAEGITTSLGQVSELSDLDFLKSTLTNGATSVRVYAQEGVYSASMLNDINSYGGLINGTPLKGNFIIIELTTIDGSVPMALYTVAVNTSISKMGAR